MNATTRVDFHCHSIYSDGGLAPAELVARLDAAGVAFAALTDHDTIDGLAEFGQAAARRGIGFITGVEITVQCNGREAHLLAYGFDPANPELEHTLRALRQIHAHNVHSITDAIRNKGATALGNDVAELPYNAASDGKIDIADAIALVHRAGGRAFLAHPLMFEPDIEALEPLFVQLRQMGLDGIEVFHVSCPEEKREELLELARTHDFLVSGGSDCHDSVTNGSLRPGVDMPTELWKEFRNNIFHGNNGNSGNSSGNPRAGAPRMKKRHFFFHVIFPTLLALGLFVAAVFIVFLPTFEQTLVDRKREMVRELTTSAWSILVEYHKEEEEGLLNREQAQEMAIKRIQFLRYGREGKDYFWLQDMHPRIIMHPYRPDLNGQDVSEFRDPRGVRIFVEFADLVRRKREGHIEYVWQWQDDPSRLVPKESYIKGFEPWGWVIGTGIYIEDVQAEIARLEASLLRVSLGISALVALLLFYVLKQSLRIERERLEAEGSLRESTERYRSLVEATTEGTLLVLDGRCRYGNPLLLQMLDYPEYELELLDLTDVLPEERGNEAAWDNIKRLQKGEDPTEGFEGLLRRRDGTTVECVFALSRISFAGRSGFILLAKEITPSESTSSGDLDHDRIHQLGQATEGSHVGIFRARAAGRGAVVAANRMAAMLLRPRGDDSTATLPTLAEMFGSNAEYDAFLTVLSKQETDRRIVRQAMENASTRTLAVSGHLVRDEHNQPRFIDGTVEDISEAEKRETERENLVRRLQTSLLFLHEPVKQVSRTAVFCTADTPIRQVAALMTGRGASAVVVQSEAGQAIGIVTDHDLRARVVAAGVDTEKPVYLVMSAPLVGMSENARIYEALLVMEEKGLRHLVLKDDAENIVGLVRIKELLQFHSYGAIVLTREIARAQNADDVITCCKRTPGLAKALLDSGAHPRSITRMITAVCDAATERFITLATRELGPPPADFAFIALGSQGRQEQTLASDQDNALIFADTDDEDAKAVREEYFLALGNRVCNWLDQAGYPLCRGEVMAKNPRWCRPLAVWQGYFSEWIRKAEPKQLMEFTIFFDIRLIRGEVQLVQELRSHIFDALRNASAFFPHFAQNALAFKPPSRLFGRIVGSGGGDAAGLLNTKDLMRPIISFARLYSLRHELDETHTLDRLQALVQAEAIQESTHHELSTVYDFLMRLRLSHQAEQLHAGQPADNNINHRQLGHFEETMLKQSITAIEASQKRISYDFLAGNS